MGKATYVSLPYALNGGQVTASDGSSNIAWNSYFCDGLGRTVSSMAPDGSITRYVYLGNTVKVTDPCQSVSLGYDATANSANVPTTYTYDVEGHLTGFRCLGPAAYKPGRSITIWRRAVDECYES